MKEKKEIPFENKRIRKGDKVICIAGNFKGMTGTVLSRSESKAVVQGINIRKKHLKGQRDKPGQIVEMEKPIHISNLRACNAENKPVKLRVRFDEKQGRQLYYIDGQQVLYRQIKKS